MPRTVVRGAIHLGHAAIPSTGSSGSRPRIMSEAFSAIIIVELYVFAEGMLGMIDASTTRSPRSPCTSSWSLTTEVAVARRSHPRGADQMIRSSIRMRRA